MDYDKKSNCKQKTNVVNFNEKGICGGHKIYDEQREVYLKASFSAQRVKGVAASAVGGYAPAYRVRRTYNRADGV